MKHTYKLCFKTKENLSEKTMGDEASKMASGVMDSVSSGLDTVTNFANQANSTIDSVCDGVNKGIVATRAGIGAANETLRKRAGHLVADDTR